MRGSTIWAAVLVALVSAEGGAAAVGRNASANAPNLVWMLTDDQVFRVAVQISRRLLPDLDCCALGPQLPGPPSGQSAGDAPDAPAAA